MAGFTNTYGVGESFELHTDTPNVAERIRQENRNRRVITLQLDGDELDAALWGLANYNKQKSHPTRISPSEEMFNRHGRGGH